MGRGETAPLKVSKKGKVRKFCILSCIKAIKISFSVIFKKESHVPYVWVFYYIMILAVLKPSPWGGFFPDPYQGALPLDLQVHFPPPTIYPSATPWYAYLLLKYHITISYEKISVFSFYSTLCLRGNLHLSLYGTCYYRWHYIKPSFLSILKVDMPILTCIFFTFNWLTLTSEMHFVKFHPEVASCLLSRGKRKYAPLGMRLL